MVDNKKCSSCSRLVSNDKSSVKFPCPNCNNEIIRCKNCRRTATKYKCKKCTFEGP